MKLELIGHEDRYAVEQLQLALFPDETMEPVSTALSFGRCSKVSGKLQHTLDADGMDNLFASPGVISDS